MDARDPMMLLCTLGTGRFAVPAADVIAILPMVPLWRPPGLPRPLVGFARVRGDAVAVLAPAALLDDAPVVDRIALNAHLVQVRDGAGGTVCLLVDRADAVVAVPVEQVRPVDAALSQRGCVIGETQVAGGSAMILAVDRLLADSARMRIAALAAEAARADGEWAA